MNLSIYLLSIVWTLLSFSQNPTIQVNENVPQVYPNPATKYVFVPAKVIGEIDLYTITGDRVRGEWIKVKENLRLDVRELSNGLYFLKIRTKTGREVTERLVIEGH